MVFGFLKKQDNKKKDVKNTLFVENIGNVMFIQSQGVRRVRISVSANKGVKVTFPFNVSLKYAQNVLLSKQDWVNKHIEKFEQHKSKQTIFDASTTYRTKWHTITLQAHNKRHFSVSIENDSAVVFYPASQNLQSEQSQQSINKAIEYVWKAEARAYLPQRIQQLANQHRLKYATIKIGSARTRWGSCSPSNNINLSLHLMRLPDELIDYVLLHELAHTVHKNHSPDFWHFLQQICPDALKLDKQLNKHPLY